MPDMSGGVSSFHVYAPGLIAPMVIGDVTAPVLRIVTIRGMQDRCKTANIKPFCNSIPFQDFVNLYCIH